MLVSAVVLSLLAGARFPRANRISGWPVPKCPIPVFCSGTNECWSIFGCSIHIQENKRSF